jgi:hypothetical protein
MSNISKLLEKIIYSRDYNNINFQDLCNLLKRFGFNERIKGDHHIFTRNDIEEILNLQPKGAQAKNYQIKQIQKIIIKYKLGKEFYEQV